jgi:hypothetical protein
MHNKIDILVKLLAQSFAVWSPARQWNMEIGKNLFFSRRRFVESGIRWLGPGDETRRKAAERTREALANDGFIAIARSKERTLFVRLTGQGEAIAAALVGLPSLAESIATLKMLVDHPAARVENWVGEDSLLGISLSTPPSLEDWREAVYGLLQKFWLPISRGWAEVNSTVRGLAFYRLLPEGRKILSTPLPTELKRPEPSLEAVKIFWDEYFSAREKLSLPDDSLPDSEIGILPLSASMPLLKNPPQTKGKK